MNQADYDRVQQLFSEKCKIEQKCREKGYYKKTPDRELRLVVLREAAKERDEALEPLLKQLKELLKTCDHYFPHGEDAMGGFDWDNCSICGAYPDEISR